MKKIVIYIILFSFLNFIGCVSYDSLQDEKLKSSKVISGDHRILLSDGSQFDYHTRNFSWSIFIRVDNPTELVIGKGNILNRSTGKSSTFEGELFVDMIDSTKVIIQDDTEYHIYWTKDNSRVTLERGEFTEFKEIDSAGYWIIGLKGNEKFIRKFDFEEVKDIQKYNENYLPFLIITIAAGVLLFIWLVPQFSETKSCSEQEEDIKEILN